MTKRWTMLSMGALLAACSGGAPAADEPENANLDNVAIRADWPDSLAVIGEGYPKAGDPCRRVGESAATRNWLDDSADLVGCPAPSDAAALGGKLVGTVEGITLVSVPRGAGNAGMGENGPVATARGDGDAKVAGTDYEATAQVACSMSGGPTDRNCPAGVKRKALADGTSVIEVEKPDGRKRAIFFDATTATGADSAQADGSAAYKFAVTKQGDEFVVRFGPEIYRIPEALVYGG